MKASAFEFRFRRAISTIVVCLGFYAPWIEVWGSQFEFAQRISTLEWIALELSRLGLLSFTVATPVVIIAGSLLAAVGAALRIWGTAYLGSATVQHTQMQAGAVMADGPYRYVRNPLYLGSWFMVVAMAFIMPPTGALFAVALLTVFHIRLIFAEEAFLTAQLGEPYREYLRAVPRLFPRLRTTLPSAGVKPNWPRAVAAELNPIGVFITLSALSWTYNNGLMIQAVVVSFGLSLVARALLPASGGQQSQPQSNSLE
jgi:protein-S-isoprenylcysteine O-methyltransferase Ste14